jgi:CRP/FNR family transcriptional regulator, cyclic AMP receptor protein
MPNAKLTSAHTDPDPRLEVTFVTEISTRVMNELRSRGRIRSYSRGSVLFHEAQASDHIAIMLSGAVKVTVCDDHGRQSLLAIRGPGELIGELGAMDGRPRSGTVTALGPVEALVVPASVFRTIMAAEPSAKAVLMDIISSRLRDSDQKRAEFGTRDAGARVAARLVELADRFGERDEGSVRVNLPITQDEIAHWTGCSREAVAKALQAMRELRWLETARRSILILAEAALRDRANV